MSTQATACCVEEDHLPRPQCLCNNGSLGLTRKSHSREGQLSIHNGHT